MDIIITDASATKFKLEDLLRADREAWGEIGGETDDLVGGDHLVKSPLKIFPEGFFVASVNGRPAGILSTLIINYELDNPIATWEEVSSDGWFTNHNPTGNALYGISLGVSYKYQGMKLGSLLVERAKKFTVEQDLEFIVLGARVPFYHKYPDMDVREYIEKRNENGERFDPELRFYERCGMTLGRVLQEYMSGKWADSESLNYGVMMYWMNPHYSLNS